MLSLLVRNANNADRVAGSAGWRYAGTIIGTLQPLVFILWKEKSLILPDLEH